MERETLIWIVAAGIVLWIALIISRRTGRQSGDQQRHTDTGAAPRPVQARPTEPHEAAPTAGTSSRSTGTWPPAPATPPLPAPSPTTSSRSSWQPPVPAPAPAEKQRPAGDGLRWLERHEVVTIGGRSIGGGMFYVGNWRDSYSAPKCLIDRDCPLSRHAADIAIDDLGYWPSYSRLDVHQRAAFLNWLASGRNDPRAAIGYVFIYFYGLERRILLQRAMSDADAIIAEVERLRGIYGTNDAFERYSRDFLFAVALLKGEGVPERPILHAAGGFHLPQWLILGIGHRLDRGLPLDADWVMAWALHHPETRLRTPARRAFSELCALFRARFDALHPGGLRLARPRTNIGALNYRVASQDFEAKLEGSFSRWPSIERLTKPVTDAQALIETCTADLDAYSRLLGRDPGAAGSIQAQLLLPPELRDMEEGALGELRAWLMQSPVVTLAEALPRFGVEAGERIGKASARGVAEMAAELGFGMEPDVRHGARTPRNDDLVVFFPQADAATADAPGDTYQAAALALTLCAIVAHADDVVTPEEERHLAGLAAAHVHLSESEQCRLDAHVARMLKAPPSLASVQSRLTALPEARRHEIMTFLVALAAADGQVAVSELKLLEKLYKLVGLEPTQLFTDIHALEAGDDAISVVQPATPGPTGRRIPPPPAGTPASDTVEELSGVRLDMSRIERIRHDTAQVSALLSGIFVDETQAAAPPEPELAPTEDEGTDRDAFDGLDQRHEALLRQIAAHGEIPRETFRELCSSAGLMPDGTIETLNEWAFDRFDAPIVEDGDPLVIDTTLLSQSCGQLA
ncbi:TerB N-terminal domain-containing protein (plasmid) [Tistrella mobilis]|uniref:tellurite resistance TerB family protein n=1 Tax=Tistrella mobilis TaxID=171437 RepID=UPI003556C789